MYGPKWQPSCKKHSMLLVVLPPHLHQHENTNQLPYWTRRIKITWNWLCSHQQIKAKPSCHSPWPAKGQPIPPIVKWQMKYQLWLSYLPSSPKSLVNSPNLHLILCNWVPYSIKLLFLSLWQNTQKKQLHEGRCLSWCSTSVKRYHGVRGQASNWGWLTEVIITHYHLDKSMVTCRQTCSWRSNWEFHIFIHRQ